MASRQRLCVKCGRELVNENGVHMGIPFGHRFGTVKVIACAKCYDEVTIKDNIQTTGQEVV